MISRPSWRSEECCAGADRLLAFDIRVSGGYPAPLLPILFLENQSLFACRRDTIPAPAVPSRPSR
jgi:hypothetical protein